MDPIATYSDRLVQVSRHFALYRDKVVVEAKWLSGKQYTSTVELADLRPEPRMVYVRYRLARTAGWVLAIGMLVLAAGVYWQKPPPLSVLTMVGMAVAFVGFVVTVATYRNRRVLFARFMDAKDEAALDMAEAGPERREFEGFVQRVQKQIRAAKRG